MHGRDVFTLDLRGAPHLDLCRRRLQQQVRGRVNNGLAAAIWLGVPCNSWSRARDRPGGPPRLRTDTEVMGLSSLVPGDLEKVRTGNILMRFAVSLIHVCIDVGVPVAVENPHMSRLWLAPPMIAVSKKMQSVVSDFCQHQI